jgi:peptide/nickel transport system substrate-binding protein
VTTDLTGTNALGYSAGYEAWDCPTSIMLFVGFNAAKGVCSDQLVRQALSRCFDRNTVATARFVRHATAAVLPVSPFSPLYDGSLAEQLDYSAQAASEFFAQAGYALTDGMLKKAGVQLSLTFLVNSENSFKAAAADYLAKELGALGIAVDLRKLGWNDYEKALRAGAFDLYLGETMLTPDFDLSELVAKTGALNYGNI